MIATTEPEHQYSQSLYGAMRHAAVVSTGVPDSDLARRLREVDIFHMAWPECWVGLEPDASARVIDASQAADVPIVWTRHNLLPHRDQSCAATTAATATTT